jgi:hypothetical protein
MTACPPGIGFTLEVFDSRTPIIPPRLTDIDPKAMPIHRYKFLPDHEEIEEAEFSELHGPHSKVEELLLECHSGLVDW